MPDSESSAGVTAGTATGSEVDAGGGTEAACSVWSPRGGSPPRRNSHQTKKQATTNAAAAQTSAADPLSCILLPPIALCLGML